MLDRLEGVVRDYAWGKPDGVSEVLGARVAPPGTPEAEYWLQTDELLLKVLAAARPLSLQVHPGPSAAADGYAREEALGVPVGASHRSYKDRGAKTELILALSDRFEALSGFRSAAEATRQFALLVDAAGPEALSLAVDLFPRLADDATVGEAFLWLVSPAGRPLVDLLLPALVAHSVEFPIQAWLAELYPGDAGVVASILLGHVVLRRGEVLAAPTGTIHAYLYGTGVELMVQSDNVLRGGLTPKHVDLAELGRVVDVHAGEPAVLAAGELPGVAAEFALPAVWESGAGALSLVVVRGAAMVPLGRDAIALCLGGAFELHDGTATASIGRGEALRISGADAVAITGEGELYLAR